MGNKKLSAWLNGALLCGGFGLLLWMERRRPLRRQAESKLRRGARNLAVAAVAGASIYTTERPVAGRLTALVERRGWGLLKRRRLPRWLEVALAVVLMDYTLYWWHVLAHRAPWLWRFHVAHHVDLDLDVLTSVRFHFGELMLSVIWRAGQILLIGVAPPSLSAWQTFLFLSVMFHHSNVRLPMELEGRLNRFIVTPRMHGIHHSTVREETDSNWSSGLTLWDWLHGTLNLDAPQEQVVIGVPAYRDPDDVTLPKILAMPFGPQRPTWQLPDNRGSEEIYAGL